MKKIILSTIAIGVLVFAIGNEHIDNSSNLVKKNELHKQKKLLIDKVFTPYSSKTKSYNYRQDVKDSYYKVDKSLIRQFGMALNQGNFKRIKKIIQSGVNVNIRFASGITPLHLASARGRLDIVKYLLKHGADTSAMDKDYAVPAFVAFSTNQSKVMSYLLSYEQKFNNEKLENKIQSAIISNNITEFKKIFQKIDVNIPMYGKKRPLHSTSQSGQYEMVKYLIERGANVNQLDVAGISPLHEAIKSNSPKIVKLLVESGAYIGIVDVFNRDTISLYSEYMKDKKLQKYLIKKEKNEHLSMSTIQKEQQKETEAFNQWLNSKK